MVSRHPNVWRLLPLVAVGLMLFADYAPISSTLNRILFSVAGAILLAFSGSYYWQERRKRQEKAATQR